MKLKPTIQCLAAIAAIAAVGAVGIRAEESVEGLLQESEERGEERFASVTEAVADDPENAATIVGSLAESFPESAAAIAVSGIEGLPEKNSEAVREIVDAVVKAAPDRGEAVETAVAGAFPEYYVSGETAGGEEELPARLQREVRLVDSLIGTFPANSGMAVRRSIGRVADEEAYWAQTVVKTALAASPEHEDEIVEEAIGAAPHHRDAILVAAGRAPEDEEAPDEAEVLEDLEDPESGLPERLERELRLVESLIEAFPANAGTATRRSVGRVAEEEAFWTVAVVETALARAPDFRDDIVREAIGAAPQHEEAVLEAAAAVPEGRAEEEVEEEDVEADVEEVDESYRMEMVRERTELVNDRYHVYLDMPGAESTRQRRAVESLELRILPERYFDPYEGRYLERNGAIITGDDIVGLAFKLVPGDAEQREALAGALETFENRVSGAREFVRQIRADEDSELILREFRTSVGKVYLYPSKDRFDAEMDVDFVDDHYRLLIGGAITVTVDTAGAIRHLIENLDRFDQQYRESLELREKQMREFLEFSEAERVEERYDEEVTDEEEATDSEATGDESLEEESVETEGTVDEAVDEDTVDEEETGEVDAADDEEADEEADEEEAV